VSSAKPDTDQVSATDPAFAIDYEDEFVRVYLSAVTSSM